MKYISLNIQYGLNRHTFYNCVSGNCVKLTLLSHLVTKWALVTMCELAWSARKLPVFIYRNNRHSNAMDG